MDDALAGQQGYVNLLDHLDAVQHLRECRLAQGLCRVPNGRVRDTRPLRKQVEHVVPRLHALRTAREGMEKGQGQDSNILVKHSQR